jgi:integrase
MPVFPERLKEAPPRKGFVEQATFDKLTKAADSLWMRALLATAYAFGFRKSELLEMKVAQVDLIDKTITLHRGETKSGEPRLVAMTQDVYVLLTECVRGKDQGEFVFTRDGGECVKDMRDAWEKLTTEAGCPGLLLHDLRRSAVRNMIRRGIPERVAMQISGHKTRSVFDRYNIVSQNDLVEAARKIEAGQKAVQPAPNDFRYSLAKVRPSYEA